MLHRRVELPGRHRHNPDVEKVEWTKCVAGNSTRLLLIFNKLNSSITVKPFKNIDFNDQNMSLILLNLTQDDEGIYEEKVTFKNNSVVRNNITLSLLCEYYNSPVLLYCL